MTRNFEITHQVEIAELQLFLTELVHTPSGATVLHLGNDDPENIFCLSFQTLPNSSNGVAHVLEHTVLCGSEKFPVKDPFFSMSRRSLNTYMNALTGSDFTCYPAASQVTKDFYNLLEVYSDAVFHPKLLELSFLQEGWRYAFGEDGSLQYQGVVFNEMKGSMASPDARLWKSMMHELFPTLPYGYNSGGTPKDIPNLSYNELKAFHQTYYHPSRCLFFFCGNLPLEGHLDFIEEHVLKNVPKLPPLPLIPKEKRLETPVYKEEFYPSHDTSEEMVAIGLLTCSIAEQETLLALHVIEIILMGTDAGPLKHALLQSKLCKQADCLIENDITEAPLVIICKGCKKDSANKIDAIIQETLRQVVKDGIPTALIESAIHQLEFAKSEITSSHGPFGLSLFFRSALLKQHGVSAVDGLNIHSLFDALRTRRLEPLIVKYLIDNPHKVILTMKPDPLLGAKEETEEKLRLKAIQATLSTVQIEEIISKNKALDFLQEKQEHADLNVLPKVTLSDVAKKPRDLSLVQESIQGLNVYHHDCFTNQIVYADLHFTAPAIAETDLPYLRLFAAFLTEVGSGGRDYKSHLEYIQENVGGIGSFFSLNQKATDASLFQPTFGLRGKALYRKADKLFTLLREIISSANFEDKDRLHDLLKQHHSSLESGINAHALKYAISLSTAGLSVPSTINHHLYGLEYLYSLRTIVKEFEANPNTLIEHFHTLQEKLLGIKEASLVLSLDASTYESIKANDFYGLPQYCNKERFKCAEHHTPISITSQGRIIASPVAFTASSVPLIPYVHPDSPLLSVAAHLFENKILHKRIREQGGAYGSGASCNTMSGSLSFYSYRDPNITSSLQAFKEAVQSIAEGHFNDTDIEEAKLGLIQQLDAPITPGSRASVAFSWQLTDKPYAARESFRTLLLNADKAAIQRAVQIHLVAAIEKAPFISFANQELLKKECPSLPIYPV